MHVSYIKRAFKILFNFVVTKKEFLIYLFRDILSQFLLYIEMPLKAGRQSCRPPTNSILVYGIFSAGTSGVSSGLFSSGAGSSETDVGGFSIVGVSIEVCSCGAVFV